MAPELAHQLACWSPVSIGESCVDRQLPAELLGWKDARLAQMWLNSAARLSLLAVIGSI